MQKPKLTIAIPTYNRVEKLKLCIQQLLNQKLIEEVEILVSDNASTDGTQEFMCCFCKDVNSIRYIRNEYNIGPDRNFLNCYNEASGEYVWLLGDDDMLLPGAVENILEAIKQEPIFIHLNSCGLIEDDSDGIQHSEPRFKEEGLLIYNDKNEMLDKISVYITFLSAMVLKTELVKKIKNKEQYIDTFFLQSHIALRTLQYGGKSIIVMHNCLAATDNRTINYDLYYVWFENFHKLLSQTGIQSGFDAKLLDDIYYRELNSTVWYFVKLYRRTCPDEKKWNKGYIFYNIEGHYKLKIKLMLFVYCPRVLLKPLAYSIKGLKILLRLEKE